MAKLNKYLTRLARLELKRCIECKGQGGWKEYGNSMIYKFHTCKVCKGEGMTDG